MNALCPRTRQRMLSLESRELTWTRIPSAAQQEALELLCHLILKHVRNSHER